MDKELGFFARLKTHFTMAGKPYLNALVLQCNNAVRLLRLRVMRLILNIIFGGMIIVLAY